MTSLMARSQYKGRRKNTSSTSFVFTDCFDWSMLSGKCTVFYLLSWRALVRRLRSVWIRVLAIWHPMNTHNLCVFCLGEEHARDVLDGETFFYEKAPLQSVPLSEERGAAVCFLWFGTHHCRGTEENEIVGFAVGFGRWVREGAFLSCASADNEGELLDCDDAISQSSCPAYDELLEVMECQKYFCHKPPARVSLSFLPDLHAAVEKEWKKQFFSHS